MPIVCCKIVIKKERNYRDLVALRCNAANSAIFNVGDGPARICGEPPLADCFFIDSHGVVMSRKIVMVESTSHSQQIQLFQNRWLERCTVITPVGFAATWAVFIPLLVWLAWSSASVTGTEASLLGLGGLLFWFVFEYGMHRWVFHWKPRHRLLQSFVFIMHGNHHADPNDPLRNLMPPIASIPITGSVWLVFLALFGAAGTWAFVGFIVGYVIYDMLHYACHQWPMKGKVWLPFKKHHMRHHFGANEGNYAISGLVLDRMLGTHVHSLKAPVAQG